MKIGAHQLRNGLFVAPMAGITDRPFRRIARRMGAALAVSEMVSSRPELRESRKTRLRIPVVANGDVETPEEARRVLEATGADGIMIGRAAQGRPWLFREIAHYLDTGERLAPPPAREIGAVLGEHLDGLYSLYGGEHGARVARKHIGWTVRALPGGEAFRSSVNRLHAAHEQRAAVNDYFERLAA